jgi:S-disulfanyl-L-cysteine oxidoreductase SoxD
MRYIAGVSTIREVSDVSMPEKVLFVIFLIGSTSLQGADVTSFSEPATAKDIARVYWATFPDGGNLPDGSGSVAEGKPLYETHCASCHGMKGEGALEAKLVGGIGTLAGDAPVKTLGSYWPYASTVFNYIRRAMPFAAPMSLSNDDYYAITAYLLSMNGIIESSVVINRKTLAEVEMPNRDGFVNAHPKVPEKYDYMD